MGLEPNEGEPPYTTYVPRIWTVGDSTTVGVGAETLPAWRYGLYSAFTGIVDMVGSQTYGGDPDILGPQRFNEGHNGQTLRQLIDGSIIGGTEIYQPDVTILLAGINDVIAGDSAATILARMSEALDELWARKGAKGTMQIVLCPPFKPLDAGSDAVVQTVMAGIPAVVAGKSFATNITYLSAIYDSAGGVSGMNDTYHPNDLGYTRAGVVMAAGCNAAIQAARGL